MNYREKIRRAIRCPQFGNAGYGEWGALDLEKRKYIKRLLDELDRADNYVKRLYLKNKKQQEVINKAIEYIRNHQLVFRDHTIEEIDKWFNQFYIDVLDILKEVE